MAVLILFKVLVEQLCTTYRVAYHSLVSVGRLCRLTGHRCFSQGEAAASSQAFPKITTHYTVQPRDKDPRWKGLVLHFHVPSIFNSLLLVQRTVNGGPAHQLVRIALQCM